MNYEFYTKDGVDRVSVKTDSVSVIDRTVEAYAASVQGQPEESQFRKAAETAGVTIPVPQPVEEKAAEATNSPPEGMYFTGSNPIDTAPLQVPPFALGNVYEQGDGKFLAVPGPTPEEVALLPLAQATPEELAQLVADGKIAQEEADAIAAQQPAPTPNPAPEPAPAAAEAQPESQA